jgi:hypothetical protein
VEKRASEQPNKETAGGTPNMKVDQEPIEGDK